MFDFQMSSVRSVSIMGVEERGVVWEGLWRRRVEAGSWRLGKGGHRTWYEQGAEGICNHEWIRTGGDVQGKGEV